MKALSMNTPRAPIVLVVDTREQEPYSFDSPDVKVIRRALVAGDYSIAGHEHQVAVERKDLDDFVRSVTTDSRRFFRELERLSGYEGACVVVEGSLADVARRRYRSGAHPSAVFGAAVAACVEFGVPVFFCSSRPLARRFTELFLRRWHDRLSTREGSSS